VKSQRKTPPDLTALFRNEANQRFADMASALVFLETDPTLKDQLEILMRRFHSFAGVSGLEGLEMITSLGSRGELEVRRLIAEGATADVNHLRRWRSMLEIMKEDVEERHHPPILSPTIVNAARRIYDVLLVDDDPEVHSLLGECLQDQGFNVNSAFSRSDAMECLMVNRPHALIVEASLSDGLGCDVIDRLRSLQSPESPAVVIVSRRETQVDRAEAVHLGADAYFSKPLDFELLASRLRSLVQERDDSVARILSVEDDLDQAAYLRDVLESAGYDVRSCGDPRQFESTLVDFAPDLILMDILLPEVSGYELARIARHNDAYQTTPILFLTTEGQLHTRIQSMRSGGDDHIVKPVSPNLLLAAVETRIERARQIRRYLDHDNLTGLLNRDAFLRRVKTRIARAEGTPAALAMLDVDRFKQINDTHGHAFGDQVLSRLSSFLRTRVRVSDSVGRYGGEEFTMLINDATEQEAAQLLDRLRAEFAAIAHTSGSGRTIFATFSAGVVTMPRTVDGIARALEAADAALYRAKAEGRNCIVCATPRFPARISA
jgi:diguanylate cyclase (GGDEF)-like protein